MVGDGAPPACPPFGSLSSLANRIGTGHDPGSKHRLGARLGRLVEEGVEARGLDDRDEGGPGLGLGHRGQQSREALEVGYILPGGRDDQDRQALLGDQFAQGAKDADPGPAVGVEQGVQLGRKPRTGPAQALGRQFDQAECHQLDA